MVIDEYNETNKRYEFLTKESEDLEKAIISLREVVKEMNQKIDKEFAETYEEINKEFAKYFRIIFAGGNAHLSKVKIVSRKAKLKDEDFTGRIFLQGKIDGLNEALTLIYKLGSEIYKENQ